MDKSLQMRAILIGGISAGVLSSIPGLGMAVNCCCCGGFVTLGALAAVYYFVYKTPAWPGDGDGVLVGLGTGILAGTISGALNAFTQLFASPNPEEVLKGLEGLMNFLPSQYQDLVRQSLEQSAAAPKAPGIIFSMLIIVVLSSVAGAVAGFLGMRLFRPLRTLPALPAPTPAFYPGSYPPAGPPAPAGPAGSYWPAPAGPGAPTAAGPYPAPAPAPAPPGPAPSGPEPGAPGGAPAPKPPEGEGGGEGQDRGG